MYSCHRFPTSRSPRLLPHEPLRCPAGVPYLHYTPSQQTFLQPMVPTESHLHLFNCPTKPPMIGSPTLPAIH